MRLEAKPLRKREAAVEVIGDELDQLLAGHLVIGLAHELGPRRGQWNVLFAHHERLEPCQVEEVRCVCGHSLALWRRECSLHGFRALEPVLGDAVARRWGTVRSGQNVVQYQTLQSR